MISRLTIVGVGLLGGSIARAARGRGLAREIVGVGREASRLAPARADGSLDRATTDLAEGVRGADMVVLAAPVLAIERLLAALAPAVGKHTVVTDVGSTKAAIVHAAERAGAGRAFHFVGSHPMAGSERAGYAVARADLFEGATVIVTPTEASDPGAVKDVTGLWTAMGARVSVLDPLGHDRVVAAISHLPHAVAFALMAGARAMDPAALGYAARGFKDTTRIAASDPVVWSEIFQANREALLAGLAHFRHALDEVEALVRAGDGAALKAWIARVRTMRETLA